MQLEKCSHQRRKAKRWASRCDKACCKAHPCLVTLGLGATRLQGHPLLWLGFISGVYEGGGPVGGGGVRGGQGEIELD